MKIQRTMNYGIPPEEAYEMACLPEFQERKCADAGALSWNVRIMTGDDGGTVISTRRTLPTVGFPSMLRKLLPEGMVSTEKISWSPEAAADGSRTAVIEVDFHGAPARLQGTIHLEPTSEGGSVVRVDADFKASVPLIGGKVEKLAAPIIINVIDSEQETGRTWVADTV